MLKWPAARTFTPHLTEYGMAVAKLNDHFLPKKNATYERYELRKLKQEPNEKVANFVMRLRKQAERCDLGGELEKHVKDQFIGKVLQKKLRKKLLALGDVELDDLIREAKAFGAVEERSRILDDEKPNVEIDAEVDKIDFRSKPSNQATTKGIECHRCCFTGHRQFDEKCPARGKTCNKCGGLNHFSRECRTSNSRKRPRQVIEKTTPYGNDFETRSVSKAEIEPNVLKRLKTDENETVKFVNTATESQEYIFNILNSGDCAKNEIECKIGDVKITAVIDSGSKYNILRFEFRWSFRSKHRDQQT